MEFQVIQIPEKLMSWWWRYKLINKMTTKTRCDFFLLYYFVLSKKNSIGFWNNAMFEILQFYVTSAEQSLMSAMFSRDGHISWWEDVSLPKRILYARQCSIKYWILSFSSTEQDSVIHTCSYGRWRQKEVTHLIGHSTKFIY